MNAQQANIGFGFLMFFIGVATIPFIIGIPIMIWGICLILFNLGKSE